MRIVLSSVLLSLALSGCASAGVAGSGGRGRDPNLISSEELREAESEGIGVTCSRIADLTRIFSA